LGGVATREAGTNGKTNEVRPRKGKLEQGEKRREYKERNAWRANNEYGYA
jgi:hypothetical protein